MDQQFVEFLNSIKEKVKVSYDKFLLFFDLFSLLRNGVINVPISVYMIFAFASLYVISPIDLIPDFIPFVGFLDDLSLIGLVFGSFTNIIRIGKAVIKAREKFNKKNIRIFEENECVICLTRKPEVLYDCGHRICCKECQRLGNFRSCFICNR